MFVYQPLVLPGSASNHDLDLYITYTVLENMAKCTRINITNYNKEHQSQLYGVAPLVQYLPNATSPTCKVGWFAKTKYFVLGIQSICPVRQKFQFYDCLPII